MGSTTRRTGISTEIEMKEGITTRMEAIERTEVDMQAIEETIRIMAAGAHITTEETEATTEQATVVATETGNIRTITEAAIIHPDSQKATTITQRLRTQLKTKNRISIKIKITLSQKMRICKRVAVIMCISEETAVVEEETVTKGRIINSRIIMITIIITKQIKEAEAEVAGNRTKIRTPIIR